MPRPPLARERVLDAFEDILVRDGERAATLDATAKAAGVSKGGLLYHFGSKDELAEGLIERLNRLVDEDVTAMASAEEGPVSFFIRTSVMENDPLDRAIIAVSRLSQGGYAAAPAALQTMRTLWADTLRPHVRDEASLDLVMLVSDGLYFNNTLDLAGAPTVVPGGTQLSALISLVQSATAPD